MNDIKEKDKAEESSCTVEPDMIGHSHRSDHLRKES